MQASNRAIELIKECEGLKLKMYYCKAGFPTIGYGHKITASLEPELLTKIITKEYAEKLLEEDLKYFVGYLNEVISLYELSLTQNQFDALCSFCFNLGSFKDAMLERFKNKDLTAVGNSITLYNKVNGKEDNGLINRRQKEQQLFFS